MFRLVSFLVALVAVFLGLLLSPVPTPFARFLPPLGVSPSFEQRPYLLQLIAHSLLTMRSSLHLPQSLLQQTMPSAQIGMAPILHYGIPWKYSFDELSQADLTGQRAIVTGANAGLGYATTEELYKLGAHVTMACRNPEKCSAGANRIRQNNASTTTKGTIVTRDIDTESLGWVRKFALEYLKENEGEALDMLFLNAGTSMYTPIGFQRTEIKCVPQSINGIEFVFQANYVGHHLLYRLLEPMLHRSKMARVVSTSSMLSFFTYSFTVATDLETLNGCSEPFRPWDGIDRSYGQSKLAQILWTKYLARQLGPDSNIYVNTYHPGAASTEFAQKSLQREDFTIYFWDAIILWLDRHVGWSAAEGALTGLFLGVATDRLKKENIRGKYYHPQAQEVSNPLSMNETLQDELWRFSEELIQDFL